MRRSILALIALVGLVAPGCSSYVGWNAKPSAHTEIVLKENDFKALKGGYNSSQSCWYVFGLIPIGNPNLLSRAMSDVRGQAKLESKAAQLVNYTLDDRKNWYFIFAAHHQLTVTADAIEYTK